MATITTIQFKRGNKAALEEVLKDDQKPLKGEPIWEIDTNRIKVGDGEHNYIDLPYLTVKIKPTVKNGVLTFPEI